MTIILIILNVMLGVINLMTAFTAKKNYMKILSAWASGFSFMGAITILLLHLSK